MRASRVRGVGLGKRMITYTGAARRRHRSFNPCSRRGCLRLFGSWVECASSSPRRAATGTPAIGTASSRTDSCCSPGENQWVLSSQNAAVWCTVTAFLDHHLLGKDWQTPDLLR